MTDTKMPPDSRWVTTGETGTDPLMPEAWHRQYWKQEAVGVQNELSPQLQDELARQFNDFLSSQYHQPRPAWWRRVWACVRGWWG